MSMAQLSVRQRLALGVLHRLPLATPGRNRLARRLLGGIDCSLPRRILHRGGALLELPSILDAIGWHLLVDGIYEPREHYIMQRALKPGGWMVDVGANIGAHSVPLALGRPDCRVIAVEPAPANAKVLRRNIELNALQNIVVDIRAAGREHGAGSIVTRMDGQYGGTRVTVAGAPGERVAVVPLDEIVHASQVGRVDLLKIDVEGDEFEVINGATRLLASNPGITIVFESLGDQSPGGAQSCVAAQELLLDCGFALARLHGRSGGMFPVEKASRKCFGTLVAVRGRSVARQTHMRNPRSGIDVSGSCRD